MSTTQQPFETGLFKYINRNKTLIMSQKITYTQLKNDRYYIKMEKGSDSIPSYQIVLVTNKTLFYVNYQELSNKNNSPTNDYTCNFTTSTTIDMNNLIEKETREEICFYYIGSKEFIENKEESYNLTNQLRHTSNYQTPPSSRLHNEFAGGGGGSAASTIHNYNPLRIHNYNSGGGNGMFINTTGLNYGVPLFPDIFESLVSGATTPTTSSSSSSSSSLSSSSASKIKPTDIEELKDEETEQEKEQYKEAFRCKICYMNKINITLIPCGHLFCSECDKKRTKDECPICREKVKDTQAIFLN
jgi:hypothetical protein